MLVGPVFLLCVEAGHSLGLAAPHGSTPWLMVLSGCGMGLWSVNLEFQRGGSAGSHKEAKDRPSDPGFKPGSWGKIIPNPRETLYLYLSLLYIKSWVP